MNVEIIVPGKISAHLLPAYEYYLDRLDRYVNVNVSFVNLGGDVNVENPSVIKKREAEHIQKRLRGRSYILIDLGGRQLTSEEFAELISQHIPGKKELVFVIGGPVGVDETLKREARSIIELSKMTFTHEFCVVILLEQLFRAFKIIKNERYHY
ncbi:50S rRNA methyltransferase [Fervidobacterium thailandense]|uniref:Ribosomal RNA large subunit methyltransferase H n=1 Tax=Fervidobacterium thailandense TaxID=1008305 RepID=A0A1E3G5F9_9BACT|nr:50S rRNA methyltransferase [Fervidobacterium thailandense]